MSFDLLDTQYTGQFLKISNAKIGKVQQLVLHFKLKILTEVGLQVQNK